jgi:hypothetical protein
VAGTCECGNELLGYIKCGEFLDWLQNQLASQEGLCSMEEVCNICEELHATFLRPYNCLSFFVIIALFL